MATLDEIKTGASHGFSRPNRYWVLINPPRSMFNKENAEGRTFTKDMREMLLNCSQAVFPSKVYATAEHRIKGPLRKMPYDTIYNDVTFQFYNDGNFEERAFFEDWMNIIYKKQKGEFEYWDNYTTTIQVAQLNMQNRPVRKTTLFEAYPINISEIGLGYENQSQIQTFTVTFAYRDFESESIKQTYRGIPEQTNGTGNIIDRIRDFISI